MKHAINIKIYIYNLIASEQRIPQSWVKEGNGGNYFIDCSELEIIG